jgi:AcrR family transcriptional regulator
MSDPKEQLFEAAERVLVSAGPSGLTSRAVTTEAGCAKGVLHRHFSDFDTFLADLVIARAEQIHEQSAALTETAGTGNVASNLTTAMIGVFGPVAVSILGLVISRDGLRERLRDRGAERIPIAVEATAMVARYLSAEKGLGRVVPGADVDALAPTLIGAAHLLFADRMSAAPDRQAVEKMVKTVVGSALAD